MKLAIVFKISLAIFSIAIFGFFVGLSVIAESKISPIIVSILFGIIVCPLFIWGIIDELTYQKTRKEFKINDQIVTYKGEHGTVIGRNFKYPVTYCVDFGFEDVRFVEEYEINFGSSV